jgi:hypothetical protein
MDAFGMVIAAGEMLLQGTIHDCGATRSRAIKIEIAVITDY